QILGKPARRMGPDSQRQTLENRLRKPFAQRGNMLIEFAGDTERATLRTLIDNMPDGIFLKDRECRFIFANQFTAELMGAPGPAVLIGKTDHDFYPRKV